jgi:hypothetical protein
MVRILKIILLIPYIFIFSAMQAQVDTVIHRSDTLIEEESDCTNSFFERGEKLNSPAKTWVVTKSKKTMPVAAFMKTSAMSSVAGPVLADLDKDGKKELVISNFTGGAHCCDELYIFRNTGPNKYQYVSKLFAGNTCITETNDFLYDFYEQFGYFFTCYACGYEDTSDTGPDLVHHIILRYNKGKMIVVPGDKELRSKITDNLAKLGEQPYEVLKEDIDQDNGLRKEFALNLAVFYYSFGRNLIETQKLFNKYYKYPDAKKVWSEFLRTLNFIKKENDF